MDRRHNDPQTPHERARLLASDRLDGPLDAADATWLDGHLDGCDACRAIAAAYAEDRELLRAMPRAGAAAGPVGPDVGRARARAIGRPDARLAVGAATCGSAGEALAGIAAVLLDRRRRRPGAPARRPAGRRPSSGSARRPAASATAGATPLAVAPGDVALGRPGRRRLVHREPGQRRLGLSGETRPLDRTARPLDAGAQAIGLAQVAARVGRPRPAGRSRPPSSSRAPRRPAARSSSSRSIDRRRSRPRASAGRDDPTPSRRPTAVIGPERRRRDQPDAAGERVPEPVGIADRRRRADRDAEPDRDARADHDAEPTPSPSASPDPDRHADPDGRRGAGDHQGRHRRRWRCRLLGRRRVAGVLGPTGRWQRAVRMSTSGTSATSEPRPLTDDHADGLLGLGRRPDPGQPGRPGRSRVDDRRRPSPTPGRRGMPDLGPARSGDRQAARVRSRRAVAAGGRPDRSLGRLLDRRRWRSTADVTCLVARQTGRLVIDRWDADLERRPGRHRRTHSRSLDVERCGPGPRLGGPLGSDRPLPRGCGSPIR